MSSPADQGLRTTGEMSDESRQGHAGIGARRVELEQILEPAAEPDHYAAVMALWPPQEVVVVAADRRGQAEHIDRGRLTVIVTEEHGLFLLVGRQRAVDLRYLGREFPPAEHVGVVLGQQADIPVLLLGVRHDPERALIGGELLDRQGSAARTARQ
jgi:hypothetical protein